MNKGENERDAVASLSVSQSSKVTGTWGIGSSASSLTSVSLASIMLFVYNSSKWRGAEPAHLTSCYGDVHLALSQQVLHSL